MVIDRFRSLALWACIGLLAGCSKSQPQATAGRPSGAGVVATFTGQYDAATGKLSMTVGPAATSPGAITIQLPWYNGVPGSNPADTFELNTVAFGTDNIGCGAERSFWGDIEIRSFFRNQGLSNVYAEITDVPAENTGCQKAAAVPGVSAAQGLWSYGAIGHVGSTSPPDSVTRRWHFRYVGDGSFTFHGRIWGDLSYIPPGGSNFDWTPSVVAGSRGFQEVGTTISHLVWDGTNWVDHVGTIEFVKVGSPGSTFSLVPGAPYASGMTSGNYFVANPANGANAIRTDGDFTVCAKFKPGRHPFATTDPNTNKILIAKGQAESPDPVNVTSGYEGWALMQMHQGYCFHYRTELDNTLGRSDIDGVMAAIVMGTLAPETYAYDYMCGGRAGNIIYLSSHNGWTTGTNTETTTFANEGADLPLVIGAYADGSRSANDVGLYEVIFDRRPASMAVMSEIIDSAEQPGIPVPATYVRSNSPQTITAVDGLSYTMAPYTIPPIRSDGSGYAPEGTHVQYAHPLSQNTSTTGFCVGAEIQATGSWSNVSGGLLEHDFASDRMKIYFGPGGTTAGAWRFVGNFTHEIVSTYQASWTTGSAHVVKACVEPAGYPGGQYVRLYSDGNADGFYWADNAPDLSALNRNLDIGAFYDWTSSQWVPLSGARIRRVFACPSPVAADCN